MRPREPLLPRRGDGYCELPLGGREVMRFDVTSLTFRLESWIEDDDFFVITFEEPLVLDRGGGRWAFDLGNQPPTAMAPALILVGLEVERALAYDDGNLEIRFTDGTRLATEAGGWEFGGRTADRSTGPSRPRPAVSCGCRDRQAAPMRDRRPPGRDAEERRSVKGVQ